MHEERGQLARDDGIVHERGHRGAGPPPGRLEEEWHDRRRDEALAHVREVGRERRCVGGRGLARAERVAAATAEPIEVRGAARDGRVVGRQRCARRDSGGGEEGGEIERVRLGQRERGHRLLEVRSEIVRCRQVSGDPDPRHEAIEVIERGNVEVVPHVCAKARGHLGRDALARERAVVDRTVTARAVGRGRGCDVFVRVAARTLEALEEGGAARDGRGIGCVLRLLAWPLFAQRLLARPLLA